MNAQERTLEDLKAGVNVQIDKSGRIRFKQQPQMGLPSVEILDKTEVAQLEAENARLVKVASHTDECNTWAFIDEPCDCHMGLIKQLEAENVILREMVGFWELGHTDQGEYEGLVMALADALKEGE